MSDLDRYLTDERVDAATRALRRPLTPHRAYGYGDFEDAALASLSAVLPDIIRQAKADALREAADDINARRNGPELIAAADKWGGYYAGIRAAMENEETALRARADRIEQGGQP